MTKLIEHHLFRSLVLAACICTTSIPCGIPSHGDCNDDPNDETVMKVPDHHSYKSRKKKRRKSVVDSGATIHCIKDRSLFTHLDTSQHVHVRVADNKMVTSQGVGTCAVKLKSASDGAMHTILLHNCIYVPDFQENLISTRRLWLDNRISTHMGDTSYFKCYHTKSRYYFSNDNTHMLTPAARRVSTQDINLIHARFNHCGEHRLKKMFDVTRGLGDKYTPHDPHTCPACIEGGHKKKSFAKRRSHIYSYFGERISSDLCGPFPKSVDGFTYALCFVDAYSNYCALYLLKSKSSVEVKAAFNDFLDDHKDHLSHGQPVTWHTDNGGEFMSKNVDEFCQEFAVHRSFSVPYAPPQNPQAERMWGLLLRPVRIMLCGARIDDSYTSNEHTSPRSTS